LEQKARELAEQNVEVERKNQEIEQARRALEEKATELALTSKYKSEFLANMSHELRTPLNSILILGQQLAENPDTNLTPKQVDFARTIHGAGTDLLNLISDILDLSKIESGTVTVDAEEVSFVNVLDAVARPFRHIADGRQLDFAVKLDPSLDRTMLTDSKRLQQVLKNLLSNAFKFTAQGQVKLSVSAATEGWSPTHAVLGQAPSVVMFEAAPESARSGNSAFTGGAFRFVYDTLARRISHGATFESDRDLSDEELVRELARAAADYLMGPEPAPRRSTSARR